MKLLVVDDDRDLVELLDYALRRESYDVIRAYDGEMAIEAFERAIDAAPERGSTYADVLAYLVPRGERDEALDAYHRAVGRV